MKTGIWDSSVQKILKDVGPSFSLSKLCKETLGSIVEFLIERVAIATRLLTFKSETCTRKVMKAAILIFLPSGMYTYFSQFEKKVLKEYRKDEKGHRLEDKAGLKVSVSKVRKSFKLRTRLRLSEEALISLTSMVDYIMGELLEVCCIVARETSKVRLTPSSVAMSVYSDPDLKVMFRNLKFPGVVCYSHQEILRREHSIGGRPYTKYAVRFLKRESGYLLKAPFGRLVRKIIGGKFSSNAMELIQRLTEDFGFELGKCMVTFTEFAKRTVTNLEDLHAALKVKGVHIEKQLLRLSISKPGLQRLLRKANAAKVSSKVYLLYNSAIETYLSEILRVSSHIRTYEGKRILMVSHVRKALELGGTYI